MSKEEIIKEAQKLESFDKVHTDNKETLYNALKRIKELELELTVEKDQHQEEINLHLHAEDYIKSLEKENAELKKINSETLTQLNLDNGELIIENEKLRKENAELKEANKTLATMKNDMWVELEKKRAESQGITNKLHQLTKAKEIIKELMSFSVQLCDSRHTVDFEKTREQAEQFLKENGGKK